MIRPGTARGTGRDSTSPKAGSGAEMTCSGQAMRFRLPETAFGSAPGCGTTCGSPQACFQLHQAPPQPYLSSAAAYRSILSEASTGCSGQKPHSPPQTVTPYLAAASWALLKPSLIEFADSDSA